MKTWRHSLFVAVLMSLKVTLGAGCLKSIEGWKPYSFEGGAPQSGAVSEGTYGGGWRVKAVRVVASDDGGDTFKIEIKNGAAIWDCYSYAGQPFLVGHFGGASGNLVVMHITNVTNGLSIVEWQLDILGISNGSVTVTASATLMDGGLESVFQSGESALGYLKTDWGMRPANSAAGTWFSGQVYWLKNGRFVRDSEHFPDKFVRLYDKVSEERGKAFSGGMIGKPSKLLKIRNWWCKR